MPVMNLPGRLQSLHSGGVGFVVCSVHCSFALKFVPLQKEGVVQRETFWAEAKSAAEYRNAAAFLPFCLSCPVPAYYWIRRDDPLLKSFPQVKQDSSWIRSLHDFLTIFAIDQPRDFQDPEQYVLVPDELLSRIYNEHLSCDLWMTQPIERGSQSLDDWMKREKEFTDADARLLLSQMLAALTSLREKGIIHSDIKPSNIMVSSETGILLGLSSPGKEGSRYFALTDFGSISSHERRSDSGTEAFFSREALKKYQADGYSELDCSFLLACFALGRTLYAMASGHIPNSKFICLNKIQTLWKKDLADACGTLLNARDLTIPKVMELKEKFPARMSIRNWVPLSTSGLYSQIPFDVLYTDSYGVEYGKFHEQLMLVNSFVPLMRWRKGKCFKHNNSSLGLPREIQLRPLVESRDCGGHLYSVIFPALDNAKTRKRPDSFKNYTPCTLANFKPPEKEWAQIEKIAEMLPKSGHIYFPSAWDILRNDGKWLLFGEFGFWIDQDLIDPQFFLEYFRLLAGKKSTLTEKGWKEILDWNRTPAEHYMTEVRIIDLLKNRKLNCIDYRKKQQMISKFRSVVVFSGSQESFDPCLRRGVIHFGRYLAEHQMTMVFGGGNCGMMKLLADTVLENKGQAVGIFTREFPAELIRDDLTEKIWTDTLAEQKAEMLKRADAIVVLPGSFGTWSRLFDMLEQKKNGKIHCPIGVLNLYHSYSDLFHLIRRSVTVGFTLPQHQALLKSARTPEDLFMEFTEEFGSLRQFKKSCRML